MAIKGNMAFKRNASESLSRWYQRKMRKPLILRGARQVGKSTAVQQLATQAPFFIELNLERYEHLSMVSACNSASELVERLCQLHNVVTLPENAILFIDEVQEYPEAVKWLRFFYEDFKEIAVVVAGSLFEIQMREHPQSIPVGRVEFMRMEPLSFLEFLHATNDNALASEIQELYCSGERIKEGFHQLALDRLRQFLLVGGLPEAVEMWSETQNYTEVSRVHQNLLQGYREDLLKYGKQHRIQEMQHVLSTAPMHYGSRYKTRALAAGNKEKPISEAVQLLEQAMVLFNVLPTSRTEVPFIPRPKAAKKLLPLDVGLALAQLHITSEQLKGVNIESLLDGRVAEMFVGIQLLGQHTDQMRRLFFWTREGAANSNAEVDYIIPSSTGSLPIEVKSGATGSLRSLHSFMEKSEENLCIRLSTARGGTQELKRQLQSGASIEYTLRSLPLYMAELLGQ